MTTANQGDWMELKAAARALDVPEYRIKALAAAGRIRTRDIEGVRAKYSAPDVFGLANAQKAAPTRDDGGPRP